MMSTNANQPRKKNLWADSGKWILGIIAVALVTFGLTALLITIMERQTEAQAPFTKVVELDETTVDPEVWGQNFPVQYEDYLKTEEMGPTKWGGSHPVDPPEGDPRTEQISSSRLEEDPRLVTMWKGYAFSKDYRHARGHATCSRTSARPCACVTSTSRAPASTATPRPSRSWTSWATGTGTPASPR